MIKKSTLPILFLLNFLLLQSSHGQSQLNIPDYIRQKFQSYCKSVPREEIFIHTDREEYISGEDIWFNTYLIDRQSFKPSSNSNIAYFEILNPDNKPVVQKRILLNSGYGPGHATLPDSLSSGTYTIRAYTNWMRNFLPFNCFMKDIKVYNPYRTRVFRRVIGPLNSDNASANALPERSDLRMEINDLKDDSLEIFINANEKFRSENKNLIYILVQSHGIIDHLSTESLVGENTRITFPKNSLHKGINQITVFDSKGPVADRLIYTPYDEVPEMTLYSTDSCKRRSKVTLEIETRTGSDGISGPDNLSISVSPGKTDQEMMDMKEYLILGTEFGLFAQSKIKGQWINEVPHETMDSLLLNLKSNWINWGSVFSPADQYLRYQPEKEVHYISGRLLTGNLQPEKADETVIMSAIGKEAVFQYTTTDKNGNFNFRVRIDDKPEDLIIQPDYKIKDQKVYVEPSFSDQHIANEISVDTISKPIPPLLLRQSIDYQVTKIFGSSYTGARLTPEISSTETKRFYGKPDFELNMNDFVRLDSMQEVFFELVPHVTLEYINSNYVMSVYDQAGKKLEGVPTIMIDGIIIKDLSVIAKLDPGLLEKIDVVWDPYRVGEYLFTGIVNIISKTGDLTSEIIPFDAVKLRCIAIDTVCSFVSPDYSLEEMKNNPAADYRNTLYWNPSVKTDKDGKARIEFWTSDIKSEYIINIQGFTSGGSIFSLCKTIKVK